MTAPEPTWQDYQDDLYRAAPKPWYRRWFTVVGALILVGVGLFLAAPLFSGLLTTPEEYRTGAREELIAMQQQMEVARLGGDGNFTLPFPSNPHVTTSGVTLTICMGEGNASYTATAFSTPGEYWNAKSTLPGAVTGPATEADCIID